MAESESSQDRCPSANGPDAMTPTKGVSGHKRPARSAHPGGGPSK